MISAAPGDGVLGQQVVMVKGAMQTLADDEGNRGSADAHDVGRSFCRKEIIFQSFLDPIGYVTAIVKWAARCRPQPDSNDCDQDEYQRKADNFLS